MAKKTLEKNPMNSIDEVLNDKFKIMKNRYSLNLDSVMNKSFNRALDVGVSAGGSSKAKKAAVKNKLNALKKVMLGEIDQIKDKTSQSMSRDIASNFARGASSGQLKKQLADNLGKSDYEIDRAVRTNTAYLSSISKLLAWQEQGFTHYKWVLGVKDAATRKQHIKWNGQEFSIADALAGRAPIPGHVMTKGKFDNAESINCRCGVRLSR